MVNFKAWGWGDWCASEVCILTLNPFLSGTEHIRKNNISVGDRLSRHVFVIIDQFTRKMPDNPFSGVAQWAR